MVLCKLLTAWSGVASFQVLGARVTRQGSASNVNAKFIAGVPVLNYHLAQDVVEHWVLSVKPSTSDSEIEAMCKMSKGCELTGHPDEGGVPFFSIHGTEHDLEELLSTTAEMIESIEPDHEVSIPDDEFVEDGPEDEEMSAAAETWGLTRIGADQRRSDGSGTNVYVLDTGVRVTHSQFSGRAVPQLDMSSGNLQVCSSSSSSCAADRQGHGTHCAGSAAGRTFGVAPGARVFGVKVLGDDGSGYGSWSQSALDWIARNGRRPAVASMSLGGPGTSSADRRAVDAAVSRGVTVVVAGGNSNTNACNFSPAFVATAITVGSTDSRDRRSGFSNYGSCVNIWAPGSGVKSASHRGDDRSATFSGTSMACPHVAGAAALALQASSSLSPSAVLRKLRDAAESGKISDLKSGDTNRFLNIRNQ